jgi:hypothetical protein
MKEMTNSNEIPQPDVPADVSSLLVRYGFGPKCKRCSGTGERILPVGELGFTHVVCECRVEYKAGREFNPSALASFISIVTITLGLLILSLFLFKYYV